MHINVTRALASIGDPAVPYLLAALESPNPTVRQLAAISLQNNHPEKTIPSLTAALSSPSHETRMSALHVLKTLGLEQPQLAGQITSLFQQIIDPQYTEPRTADDLGPVPDWDPRYTVDSAYRSDHQSYFHSELKNAIDELTNGD